MFVRHGPFDIQGGGGLGIFFEKNVLAFILAKTNNLAQWHCEKKCLQWLPKTRLSACLRCQNIQKKKILARSARQKNIKFKLYIYAIP